MTDDDQDSASSSFLPSSGRRLGGSLFVGAPTPFFSTLRPPAAAPSRTRRFLGFRSLASEIFLGPFVQHEPTVEEALPAKVLCVGSVTIRILWTHFRTKFNKYCVLLIDGENATQVFVAFAKTRILLACWALPGGDQMCLKSGIFVALNVGTRWSSQSGRLSYDPLDPICRSGPRLLPYLVRRANRRRLSGSS